MLIHRARDCRVIRARKQGKARNFSSMLEAQLEADVCDREKDIWFPSRKDWEQCGHIRVAAAARIRELKKD